MYRTPLMMLLEEQLGRPIEELLDGPLAVVAVYLGVDESTVSKWKTKLHMPAGQHCYHHKRWYSTPQCPECKGEEGYGAKIPNSARPNSYADVES